MSLDPREAAFPSTEKSFYLEEFHGKTVAVAGSASVLRPAKALAEVVDELTSNGTQVVLLSTERGVLEPIVGERVLNCTLPRLEGAVWRQLRGGGLRVGLELGSSAAFAATCREIAVRLALSKLVWIDREGGVSRSDGRRVSFVHLDELRERIAELPGERQGGLLCEIEAMLRGGVAAVNVCTLEGLHDELFTYEGSGTLFTHDRYVVVRRLGIDDYDAASNLIARGVEEGYLAERNPDQLDDVLASGFGAFIEGTHLAGIGALRVEETLRCAEVASLYTLTRFLGEGVGAHLLSHAVTRGRELALEYVYACTVSDRVAAFFARNGFYGVESDALPAAKWEGYDAARRERLICLRRDLV